ncbi:hypothetical protein [Hymenobacter sp. AT01-02]|uniref:hypothetical protein n=1 Tax=Hymenobacter sp. AT01-02 TaxID=1571877 RepID=UPI000697AB1E|nr:hypothetical protein [Hymenobacter sp. AT01-02]
MPDPAELFAQKTDAELLYLIQEPGRYPASVVQAAVQELQRRELIPQDLPTSSRPPSPVAPGPDPQLGPVAGGGPGCFLAAPKLCRHPPAALAKPAGVWTAGNYRHQPAGPRPRRSGTVGRQFLPPHPA